LIRFEIENGLPHSYQKFCRGGNVILRKMNAAEDLFQEQIVKDLSNKSVETGKYFYIIKPSNNRSS